MQKIWKYFHLLFYQNYINCQNRHVSEVPMNWQINFTVLKIQILLTMTAYQYSLELIQSNYCLIRHLPANLPEEIVHTHQMVRSPIDNGYVIKLNMLNSLKRLLRQIGIQLPSLPNVSFKMHRPISKQISGTWSIQEIAYNWKLFESQVRGIKFFANTGGRCIIGDEWAMGKTITALAIFEFIPDKKMLIVCPRVLLSHWIQHLYKHYGQKLSKKDVTILYQKQSSQSYENVSQNSKILITTYEYIIETVNQTTFPVYKKLFAAYSYLICDEPQTIATNQLSKKLMKIPLRVILLSDTAQKWFIQLIPIINPKIQQQQMKCRYQNNTQVLRQLESTTLKYYYIKTCRKFSKPPVYIKPVSLYGGSLNMDNQQGKSCETISQKKLEQIIDYINLLVNFKGVKQILLIYIRDQIGKNIVKLLQKTNSNLDIVYNLTKTLSNNTQSNPTKKPVVIISNLEMSLSFSESLTKQSRAIFIQLPHHSSQNQSILLETTNKLYLICQKIEYFTFRNSFRFAEEIQNYNVVVPKICFDQSEDSIRISSSMNRKNDCLSNSNISEEKQWKSNAKVVYFDADASGDFIVIQNNDSIENLSNYPTYPIIENKTEELNSDNILKNLSMQEEIQIRKQQICDEQIKREGINQMKIQYNDEKNLDEFLSLGQQFTNRQKNEQLILKQLTNKKGKKISIRLVKGVSSWKKNQRMLQA